MKTFTYALLLLSASFSAVTAQLCAGAENCPAPSCALTYVEAKTWCVSSSPRLSIDGSTYTNSSCSTDCSCTAQVAARTAAPEPRVQAW